MLIGTTPSVSRRRCTKGNNFCLTMLFLVESDSFVNFSSSRDDRVNPALEGTTELCGLTSRPSYLCMWSAYAIVSRLHLYSPPLAVSSIDCHVLCGGPAQEATQSCFVQQFRVNQSGPPGGRRRCVYGKQRERKEELSSSGVSIGAANFELDSFFPLHSQVILGDGNCFSVCPTGHLSCWPEEAARAVKTGSKS